MSILRNINYMKRFAAHPCATPNPLVMIEMALKAFAPIALELFSYQIVQTAMPMAKLAGKALARQGAGALRAPGGSSTGGTSGGHGVRLGGKHGRTSIGERLGPNTFMFALSDLEQTGLYYWMIADLATQFAARWTSLIYMHEKCPFAHQCYREGDILSNFSDRGTWPCFLPNMSAGEVFSGGYLIQTRANITTGRQRSDIGISFHGKLYSAGQATNTPKAASLQLVDAQTGEVLAKGGNDSPPKEDGARISGGFYTQPRDSANRSYSIVVHNEADEPVGCMSGKLMLSGGFCVTTAPAIPFDNSHLPGRGKPR